MGKRMGMTDGFILIPNGKTTPRKIGGVLVKRGLHGGAGASEAPRRAVARRAM